MDTPPVRDGGPVGPSSPVVECVRSNVQNALESAGLTTHRAVSEATGINQVTLWRRARSGRYKLDELAAISQATGVGVVDLAGGLS